MDENKFIYEILLQRIFIKRMILVKTTAACLNSVYTYGLFSMVFKCFTKFSMYNMTILK